MNGFEDVGEEYNRLESELEKLKGSLYDALIKYLILNSVYMDKCTEIGISENLGLKRSLVRKMLKDLLEAHILEYTSIGRSKPYFIKSIGSAIDRDYVKFSREEIHKFLSIKETKNLPPHAWFEIYTKLPGDIHNYLGRSDSKVRKILTMRFFDYVYADLYEEFKKYEDLRSKRLGLGGVSLKNLYETSLLSLGELHLKVPPNIPINNALENARNLLEGQLKNVINSLKMFASMFETLGYYGIVESLKPSYRGIDIVMIDKEDVERRFRNEYLWATTLMLREACKFAEEVGVDTPTIKEANELADILDIAIEREYKGIEKDGSLKEWYAAEPTS